MTDIKLTDADFKEFSNISGAEFYTIDEKLVKQILKNQETVERLKLAIDSYEGKTGDEFTAKILKEILGDEK
jgi:DNA polymerase sigma